MIDKEKTDGRAEHRRNYQGQDNLLDSCRLQGMQLPVPAITAPIRPPTMA